MTDSKSIAYCQLNRVFGYNPSLGRKIVQSVGGAEEVFSTRAEELRRLLGTAPPRGLDKRGLEESEAELESLQKQGCRFLGAEDDAYPPMLRECDDAPLGLYYKSTSPAQEVFGYKHSVAIVGTRDFSAYGREWSGKIVSSLAKTRQKPVIVSGLALGTDITAHIAALETGLPTIAVMATGIDSVYPRMHSHYADRIASARGSALVTDYPPHTAPIAANFLRRNRIIAGLSSATVLVESRIKGGGMVTANLAYSYNRDVYALPGKADDIRSQGCNKLIADKKADLVFSAGDLMEKLGYKVLQGRESISVSAKQIFAGKLPEEDIDDIEYILRLIRVNRGIDRDSLSRISGFGSSRTNALLALLEAEGLICTDLLGNCSIQNKI